MTTFSATVLEFWDSRLGNGTVLGHSPDLTAVCSADLPAGRRVMVLRTAETTRAVLTPEASAHVSLPGAGSWSEQALRSALAEAQVVLHPPDAVYYASDEVRRALTSEPTPSNVRPLTTDDGDAFTQFLSAAPEQDLDDASVALDDWAVLGAFDHERLVCVASMYPWDGSRLADVGVVTLPEYRGRGLARDVIRASIRCAHEHDHELQYRCQVDNLASQALAVSVGLTWFGEWEVVSPDSPV